MKALEYFVSFVLGAVLYSLIEIAWRGYTHWTMSLTGGACLCVLYLLNGAMAGSPLPLRWLAGAVSITLIEFAVGCVVNIGFRQNVWDYSGMSLNLLGQICLPFSLMWLALCIPAFYLCGVIRNIFVFAQNTFP